MSFPDVSCGVAAALTLRETMVAAMYFNTNYPHTDEEMKRYDEAEFRKYRGRKGVIEGHIHRLQVKPADYLLTVGLLPNSPTHHEFYELHYIQYPTTVHSKVDFPAMFYPSVAFTNAALGTSSISSAMVRAGQDVIARHVPLGVQLDERAYGDVLRHEAGERLKDRATLQIGLWIRWAVAAVGDRSAATDRCLLGGAAEALPDGIASSSISRLRNAVFCPYECPAKA